MNNHTVTSFQGRGQSSGLGHQKPRLKIIICGGGLAGLASALLLREDHDVTILESSTLNQELGAAITLSMNASRLLRSSLARAGFDKDKAKYVEAEKLQEVHWQDLSILDELEMEHVTKLYNEPWWYFSRKDLHSELKRAALAKDGMGTIPTLKLGAHVERVDPKNGTVHLASGETFHGDVIIGADGIRSASGNSVFGKLPSKGEELSAYRCMIPSTGLKDDKDTAVLVDCAKVLIFIGPERRIVAYPCSSWDYMNFVCIFPDSSARRSQWNDKISVQDMLDGFKDFHHSIRKALSMASETGVWQLRHRVPLATWIKGCYTLIGDAAHAMGPHQGQGGCQAMEDAEGLRVVLKGATRSDVEERLKIFDELRVGRVCQIMENTRAAAPSTKPINPLEHKSTSANADFHWGYKITQEAVELMNRHGYNMTVKDAATGELFLH